MSILQWFFSLVFKESLNGFKYAVKGLSKFVPDSRDFKYSMLGSTEGYQPKQPKVVLPILEIKNQTPNNTCVFHSYASCRENDEGVKLSPRSLVLYAKKKGYLSSNGISSIRLGQKAGIEFGIAEESLVPNDNLRWEDYSSLPITSDIQNNAFKHKAKSYFWVNTKEEWIKAIDDGHPIHTGFDWYSSYNMTGGLTAPWILPWKKGFNVGGHAVKCCGRDIPNQLFIFQNSFGPDWGDNGLFYVKMSDILDNGINGAVAVDLDAQTLQKFIASHEGKDVKTDDKPAIYRIINGQKRAYPDEVTFYAFGGSFGNNGDETFMYVANRFLDLVPEGAQLTVQESPYWDKLHGSWEKIKWERYPDNFLEIKNLIS